MASKIEALMDNINSNISTTASGRYAGSVSHSSEGFTSESSLKQVVDLAVEVAIKKEKEIFKEEELLIRADERGRVISRLIKYTDILDKDQKEMMMLAIDCIEEMGFSKDELSIDANKVSATMDSPLPPSFNRQLIFTFPYNTYYGKKIHLQHYTDGLGVTSTVVWKYCRNIFSFNKYYLRYLGVIYSSEVKAYDSWVSSKLPSTDIPAFVDSVIYSNTTRAYPMSRDEIAKKESEKYCWDRKNSCFKRFA